MSEKGRETSDFTRRTALERAAGFTVIGAAAAFAVASSSTSAAAAVADAVGTEATEPGGPGTSSPSPSSSPEPGDGLPNVVAGVRVPDTELARAATAFAREACSETLFNHVMRTYLFGSLMFDRRGVRYDRELAFVAALLHDLGLVKAYQTPHERFEVDGADAARTFLRKRHMPAGRADVVWDAIALHTNVGIATRKRPEIGIVAIGSGLDFTGNDLEKIPSDALAEILAAFPRAGFRQDAVDNMLALCRTKPMSVLMHPFAEVGRRHLPDFPVPTVEDLLLAAPFGE
ncbi:HD domain-containing protein [Streptomyces flavofungini]|uniref:HD domain-containing protein n=1 Tax=Streptomyces flavofungini TaxID=68200 RepID=UPI0034DFBC20